MKNNKTKRFKFTNHTKTRNFTFNYQQAFLDVLPFNFWLQACPGPMDWWLLDDQKCKYTTKRIKSNQVFVLSYLLVPCRTSSETAMPKASIIIILWQWKKTKAHNLKLNWWSYGKLYYSSSHQQKSKSKKKKIIENIFFSSIFQTLNFWIGCGYLAGYHWAE